MKTIVLAVLVCLFALPGRSADTLAREYARYGDLIVTQMVAAPFPHPDRSAGHRYQEKFFPTEKHYQNSTVALFVPNDFKRGNATDFVIHFHGWGGNVTNVFNQYKVIEQFDASRKNAILIVPQGPFEASDSFGGKLEDPEGFKRFMAEAVGILKAAGKIDGDEIGRIVLSGHSGGYHVISAILARGGLSARVKEVYLFDALYGQTENYVDWFKTTNGKLIDIYTRDGGTKAETEKLIGDLKRDGVEYWAGNESETPELRKPRLIFIYTELGHTEVVGKHQHFREFLKVSSLENR